MRDTINKFLRDCTIYIYVPDDRITCMYIGGRDNMLMLRERSVESKIKEIS